jgi:predicted RNA-binding protein with PIN domain
MHYLVDGHNLIPKVGNISLHEMNDEERLLDLLNQFARTARMQVEVFFDKAPAGSARTTKIGNIRTHFIQSGSSADFAIIDTVRMLGARASQVTVVTSDRDIQFRIKKSGCKILTSEEFVHLIQTKLNLQKSYTPEQRALTEDEIQDWLTEFNQSKDKPTS